MGSAATLVGPDVYCDDLSVESRRDDVDPGVAMVSTCDVVCDAGVLTALASEGGHDSVVSGWLVCAYAEISKEFV